MEGMMSQEFRYIRIIYPNSDFYLGTTENLKYSGFGKLVYQNGTKIEGYWSDEKCFPTIKDYQITYLQQIFKSPPI